MTEKLADKEVLVIIPAYNEEKNIAAVLERLEQPEIQKIADVLVMNDASSDETNWIVKGRKHTMVTHVFNLGYGSALQLGYKYAIRRGYQYVIQMDADGQHDVGNVLRIYEALKTPDADGKLPHIVLGSRYLPGSVPFPTPFLKKAAMDLFRWMIKVGTGRKIYDPTTGLQGLNWQATLYYSGYDHFDDKYPDANMIMKMLLLNARIVELPAVMYLRTEGKSMHSGIKPAIYMFRMFFSLLAVFVRIRILKLEKGGDDSDEFFNK